MQPRLLIIEGPRRGEDIYLGVAEVTTVGRHLSNRIIINDAALSRRHFSILKEAGGFRLRDLGSRNGTFVNEERIRDCVLKERDLVKAGRSHFVFMLRDKDEVAESSIGAVYQGDCGWNSDSWEESI